MNTGALLGPAPRMKRVNTLKEVQRTRELLARRPDPPGGASAGSKDPAPPPKKKQSDEEIKLAISAAEVELRKAQMFRRDLLKRGLLDRHATKQKVSDSRAIESFLILLLKR